MNFDLSDISRRLENIIRLGTIAEVMYSRTPKVRVNIGDITTDWLSLLTLHAGDTLTWSVPSIGEQCVIFSPSGEMGAGVVLPAINSQHFQAPDDDQHNHRMTFKDSAMTEYNVETHTYKFILPSDGKFLFEVGQTHLEMTSATSKITTGSALVQLTNEEILLSIGSTTLSLTSNGTTLTTPQFSGVES